VIDVRVRKDNGIELLNRKRKLTVLFGGFLPTSLEHAAVEGDSVTIDVEKMTGAGNFPRSPDKRYLQSAILLLLHRVEKAVLPAARPAT
jgi:hypothetical protein